MPFIATRVSAAYYVHPNSLKAMKGQIRKLTAKSNAKSDKYRPRALTRFVRGWVNYFKPADMKSVLKEIDQWMRGGIYMV